MPRKPKSFTVEEAGISVRVFQRGRPWHADVRVGGRRVKQALKTTVRTTAENNARELARELATHQLTNTHPDTLTLGQLFAGYRQHRLPSLTPARQREAKTRMLMFTEAWGADLPVTDIDATRIQAYCAGRRSMRLVAPGLRLTDDGRPRRGYRRPQPIRDGALDGELGGLNGILNWACGYRRDGRPLLRSNPLPRRRTERRALGWPMERNPRRPVAAHDRYERTQQHTDAVDPKGRLRCILALARYTARRSAAICALRASDLLMAPDRVRAALAAAGLDESAAAHMPHGAVRWREAADKQGLLFVTPIGPELRAELDRYLKVAARVGDVPLFPAPGRRPRRKRKKDAPPPPPPPPKQPEQEKPIRRETAATWLLRAEQRAGLPKLRGGAFHPYRRLWAIERAHLPAINVAAAGGWGGTEALTRIYQKATPAGVAAAVNGG